MKHLNRFIFLITVFLISCGVKQPVENINSNEKTGHIFVTTSPVQGAAIILDGQATGLLTPDTIKNVATGNHVVRVFLDGFQTDRDSFIVNVVENQVAQVTFQLQKIISVVTLQVTSEPAGAAIFLDNRNTGKKTPDTLSATPGTHTIRLEKNGFVIKDSSVVLGQQEKVKVNFKLDIVQRVLFESFANVSCIPCVSATENLLKFTSAHAAENYVIMEYFANWPSPNDPFYKAVPKDVDQRVNFYGVQTLPTLKLKGTTGLDPNNYDEIVSKYNQAVTAQNTKIGISIDKQLVNNQLQVKVELFDFASQMTDPDLRLFVAITEDSIHFDNPPGSNGIKDFEWVFRGFLSDRQGDLPDKSFFEYQKEWPSNWQYKHSKIIAFIQNIQNKQILQTGVN